MNQPNAALGRVAVLMGGSSAEREVSTHTPSTRPSATCPS